MSGNGSNLAKILVIEDEPVVREGLIDSLRLEGYAVVSAENGTNGIELYESESPDLVILDVMMPGLDGLEVCRRIRQSNGYTPIIILTAKCNEIDKVVGLELGADDYLTKPFGMRELFARLKAILRRNNIGDRKQEAEAKINDELELHFADVKIDFKSYRAKKGKLELNLSAKEFELIKYLYNKIDVPVTRDELLDQVWGYNSYPSTRTVDNFIARLRQKLEVSPDKPQHILTVHGVGYKFVLGA